MKKILISIMVVAVVAIALTSAGTVFAQAGTPQTQVPGSNYGMGGRGYRGGMLGNSAPNSQDGLLHEELIAIFSAKLGISVEELETRLSNGETLSAIALSTGLTFEEFRTLMLEARNQAIDQAVADGTLTQEQADWMLNRSFGSMRAGAGTRGGYNRGQFGNADCPYYQD